MNDNNNKTNIIYNSESLKITHFTQVSNCIFSDPILRPCDIGLYATILSLPRDKWHFTIAGLIKLIREKKIDCRGWGESALYSSLKRLISAGYLRLECKKNNLGQVDHWVYYVYNSPDENPYYHTEQAKVFSPYVENPDMEKAREIASLSESEIIKNMIGDT